nr:hypothetical protein [Devosia sp.]
MDTDYRAADLVARRWCEAVHWTSDLVEVIVRNALVAPTPRKFGSLLGPAY